MKYTLILLLFFITTAIGSNMIEQELRNTPEMTERCIQNIDYYNNKINKYLAKSHLNIGQRLKLRYYESELEAWDDYCNGESFDPDLGE